MITVLWFHSNQSVSPPIVFLKSSPLKIQEHNVSQVYTQKWKKNKKLACKSNTPPPLTTSPHCMLVSPSINQSIYWSCYKTNRPPPVFPVTCRCLFVSDWWENLQFLLRLKLILKLRWCFPLQFSFCSYSSCFSVFSFLCTACFSVVITLQDRRSSAGFKL